ncbi:MAG: hypothetical protein CMO66_03000 [Verrucomicrobiales bacterium]|nr:hypothetical protein [Verrucomicrobiales bacterium]
MKKIFTTTLVALAAALLPGCLGLQNAGPAKALVSVSAGRDNKVVLYEFDLKNGTLTEKAQLELPGSPGGQCLSPDGNRLYVTIRSEESVAAYDIDHANGTLEHIATTSIGANAAYIAMDHTGHTLLWASYSGGKVGTHRIAPTGAVQMGALSEIATHRCAHAILVDAANQYALVPHTCPNAVYQFKFNAVTGKLTPNTPLKVNPAEGLEPRHLAFHPTLPVVYFDDEKGDSVTTYTYDSDAGTVAPIQTTSTLPADFDGDKNSCADIEITRNGRHVYASNRGHNSIAGFKTGPDGKLTSIGQFPTGEIPRSFNLSPNNRWLIAAGQRSHDLHIYKRNPTTGTLTPQGDPVDTLQGPSWVQFIPLK